MYIYLSLFESIYILYMFNFYKTSIYYSHPFDIITKNKPFIQHDISSNHTNKICILGNIAGYLLPFWFIGRHYINKNDYKSINNVFILLLLLGTLFTNTNAFIYCIPIFIIEGCLTYRMSQKLS